MISQTAEYALRAMVFLAMNQDGTYSTDEIANASKVSPSYLSKVLQSLRRAGLVLAHRGLKGGFSLARKPREISILEIVNAVDPIKRIVSCPLELKSHGIVLCALHKRVDDAMSHVEQAFAKSTLAEILERPTKSLPLIESEVSETADNSICRESLELADSSEGNSLVDRRRSKSTSKKSQIANPKKSGSLKITKTNAKANKKSRSANSSKSKTRP